jgi:hypothetical protein
MEPMRGWQMTSLNRHDELLAHIRAPHCDLQREAYVVDQQTAWD